MKTPRIIGMLSVSVLLFASATNAFAHCDTLDGPVIIDARAALARSDIAPVLKWIKPDAEAEIRSTFVDTLAVRRLSPAAAALADRWFFETLVRLHRAGEGAAYAGLKESGAAEPGVALADRALAAGDAAALIAEAEAHVANALRQRFARAQELQQHRDENVAAGRAYVAAYVNYVHFAEKILAAEPDRPAAGHSAH